MGIHIKKCTLEDLDILHESAVKTYRETFAHMNTKENMDIYLEKSFHIEKLSKEMLDPNSEFYLLYVSKKIAGYLKLNDAPSQTDINDNDSLEIERIYVAAEFQGTGLGRFLMRQAVEKAIERSKKYIWLGVWEKNEKAIRFYKNNGFYKIGTHTFIMGNDAQTDYIMRKDLA